MLSKIKNQHFARDGKVLIFEYIQLMEASVYGIRRLYFNLRKRKK